jgi:integrase
MSAGHIQRRDKTSWRLKYDLGRDPKTGARIIKYKTERGKKSEAQAELRRLLGTVDVGQHVDPGKMTVGDWLKQWLEEARHTTSPKTHERYSEIVNQHLRPALGVIQLAKFGPVHIQGFYSDALKSGRVDGKGELSPQTVLHFHRLLDHAMKRARKRRLIAVNPVEDVDPPKVEEREMQTLDDEQAAKLLAVASTTRVYIPLVVALATGLRRGELLALRWQDIDLATGVIQVVRSLEQTKAGLRFKTTKSKRSKRPIVLPASVLAVLLHHKAKQAEERLLLVSARASSCSPGSTAIRSSRTASPAGWRGLQREPGPHTSCRCTGCGTPTSPTCYARTCTRR